MVLSRRVSEVVWRVLVGAVVLTLAWALWMPGQQAGAEDGDPTLSGVVLLEGGEPAVGAVIEVSEGFSAVPDGVDVAAPVQATTDETGAYAVAYPASFFLLRITATPLPESLARPTGIILSRPQPGETLTQDFILESRQPVVSGTVLDADGQPIVNGWVSFRGIQPTAVSPDGSFQVSVPAGQRMLYVTSGDQLNAYGFGTTTPIDVAADVHLDLVLPAQFIYRVQVVDQAGSGVPNTAVSLEPGGDLSPIGLIGEAFEAAPGVFMATTSQPSHLTTNADGFADFLLWPTPEVLVSTPTFLTNDQPRLQLLRHHLDQPHGRRMTPAGEASIPR